MNKSQLVRLTVALTALAVLAATTPLRADEKDAAAPAVAAAASWLKLVDAGDYAKSWKEAASLFQGKVTSAAWEDAVGAARKPLGKLLTRENTAREEASELPGAPDGEYVVLTFTSSFENKKTAVETVTCVKEKDGAFRVTGYFVR
jgi:hypothetical protein